MLMKKIIFSVLGIILFVGMISVITATAVKVFEPKTEKLSNSYYTPFCEWKRSGTFYVGNSRTFGYNDFLNYNKLKSNYTYLTDEIAKYPKKDKWWWNRSRGNYGGVYVNSFETAKQAIKELKEKLNWILKTYPDCFNKKQKDFVDNLGEAK